MAIIFETDSDGPRKKLSKEKRPSGNFVARKLIRSGLIKDEATAQMASAIIAVLLILICFVLAKRTFTPQPIDQKYIYDPNKPSYDRHR